MTIGRIPPKAVREHLRREVGFGCPVPGCSNPYLEYHHFDPPWKERNHHEVDGMIALCAEHHNKADAGSFTVEQLRAMKNPARSQGKVMEGRFDWLRHRLIAVVGNGFCRDPEVFFRFRGEPIIWFGRDEQQHLLLNLKMLTASGQKRLEIEANDWIAKGPLVEFECPPHGRLINARYENGDSLRIEYFELTTIEDVKKRYPEAVKCLEEMQERRLSMRPPPFLDTPERRERLIREAWRFDPPVTCVEIHNKIAGTPIEFGPTYTKTPGATIGMSFTTGPTVVIDVG